MLKLQPVLSIQQIFLLEFFKQHQGKEFFYQASNLKLKNQQRSIIFRNHAIVYIVKRKK